MERTGPIATIESTDFPVGASGSNGVPQFSKQWLGALLSLREGDFAVRLPQRRRRPGRDVHGAHAGRSAHCSGRHNRSR